VQDVPSFLQEVTTVRGQLLYATQDLRDRAGVADDVDATDEVAVAHMQLLVTLDTMRHKQASMYTADAEQGTTAADVGGRNKCDGCALPCTPFCSSSWLNSSAFVTESQRCRHAGCAARLHV
jgi:hypothetical protein